MNKDITFHAAEHIRVVYRDKLRAKDIYTMDSRQSVMVPMDYIIIARHSKHRPMQFKVHKRHVIINHGRFDTELKRDISDMLARYIELAEQAHDAFEAVAKARNWQQSMVSRTLELDE